MNRIRTSKVKSCWVATEVRGGWRLKASIGARDYPLSGLVLASREDVEKLVNGKVAVVFVRLADSGKRVA